MLLTRTLQEGEGFFPVEQVPTLDLKPLLTYLCATFGELLLQALQLSIVDALACLSAGGYPIDVGCV